MSKLKKRASKNKGSFIDYVESGARKVESIHQTGHFSSLSDSSTQNKFNEKPASFFDFDVYNSAEFEDVY